jgi:6-phosphogluconolactonase
LNKFTKIFPSPSALAEAFSLEIVSMIKDAEKKQKVMTVAISGGNTPKLLFSVLANQFSNSVNWNYVHIFWVDERIVPREHVENNYGVVRQILLENIDIPDSNVHRIRTEGDPYREARRYSHEIMSFTHSRNGLPVFDQIILGIGEDGHTASIFPGNEELFLSGKICEVTVHPVSSQKRITLTGRVINNAVSVTFLVTGKNKANIVEDIIKKRAEAENFPAYHIVPEHGKIMWFLDKEAAKFIR